MTLPLRALLLPYREIRRLNECLAEESMKYRVYHREAIGHWTRVHRLESLLQAKGIEVPPVLNDEILGKIPEDILPPADPETVESRATRVKELEHGLDTLRQFCRNMGNRTPNVHVTATDGSVRTLWPAEAALEIEKLEDKLADAQRQLFLSSQSREILAKHELVITEAKLAEENRARRTVENERIRFGEQAHALLKAAAEVLQDADDPVEANINRGLNSVQALRAALYDLKGNDMIWEQWPAGRPRPTPDEWKAAEARYRSEMDQAYASGYGGDAGSGMAFMMATYSRECWWDFFFPGEKLPLPMSEQGFRLKCRPSRTDG